MPKSKMQSGTEKKSNGANVGIDGHIAHGNSFYNDHFPDLKADYILANLPFNVSDQRGELRHERQQQLGTSSFNALHLLLQRAAADDLTSECKGQT